MRLACALALAGACGAAWSQAAEPAATPAAPADAASAPGNPRPRLSIEARAAASTNGGLDDNGMRRGDFITSIRPELSASRVGAGFSGELLAAATFVDYARGTQPDSVMPDLHGKLSATLVDRWLGFEASGYLRSAEADPFGVRTDEFTAANRRDESGLAAGPVVRFDFTPETHLLARHQVGVTRGGAGDQGDLDTNLTQVRLERKPTPLGASVELSRLDNRADSGPASHYTLTTGRLRGTASVGGELVLGALVGQDRSDFLLASHSDALYGGAVDWSPGPRTHFGFELEHRYFGESGHLRLDHRTPFMTIAVDLQREPVDAMSSLGTLAQGADLRGALDAILTTRYPDPAARATVVDGIIDSRGLQSTGSGAIDLLGDYPQLQTSGQLSLTLLGARDTLGFSAYALTSRVLARVGDPLSGLATTADNRQRGGSLQVEHRLGPQLSVGLQGALSRIAGLGADAASRSREDSWRLWLLGHLSPRSDLTLALQHYRFATTVAGEHSFDATLALIGLRHRF